MPSKHSVILISVNTEKFWHFRIYLAMSNPYQEKTRSSKAITLLI